jgi:hypothetical protein
LVTIRRSRGSKYHRHGGITAAPVRLVTLGPT